MWVILLSAAAWHGFTTNIATSARACVRSSPYAKAAPAERGEEAYHASISVGSIAEFHDPKHGSGKTVPILGIVESSAMKAKGGEVVTLVDGAGKRHTIASKALHIVLPPSKGKEREPADILKPYAEIVEKDSLSLGVDPEMLELAWEVCAEEDESSFSPKQIVTIIDERMCKSAIDQYKAFRLLTSDLGKVFFKTLSGNAFKAKSSASVKASKDAWCHAPGHGDMYKQEFCFV
jgi:hypothetical protein